jgi:hypothetical protein
VYNRAGEIKKRPLRLFTTAFAIKGAAIKGQIFQLY